MVASETSQGDVASSPLVLWCQATDVCTGPLLAFLESCTAEIFRTNGVQRAADLDELEQLAENAAEARFLLIYVPPVAALAGAMAQGNAPQSALHDWSEEVQRLLAFVRRNRRRTVLADTSQVISDSQTILASLGPVSAPAQPPSPAPPADPLLQLLAADTLRRDPGARALAGELEASSRVVDGAALPEAVDAQACFSRFHDMTWEISRLQTLAEERQTEAEAALPQLIRAQELAEECRQENARQAVELDQLKREHRHAQNLDKECRQENERQSARLEQLRQEIESRDIQLKSLEAELAAEQARSGQLSAELASERARSGGLSQEVGALSETLRLREAKLRAVLNQTTYRWTAPLRRLHSSFKHKGARQ